MNTWELYWLTRVHPFGLFIGLMAILSAAGALVVIVCSIAEEDLTKVRKELLAKFLIAGIILGFVRILIPSERDIGIIVAASYVTQIKELGEIPPKAAKVLNSYLDKHIKELEEQGK